jgi:hypothetical protein
MCFEFELQTLMCMLPIDLDYPIFYDLESEVFYVTLCQCFLFRNVFAFFQLKKGLRPPRVILGSWIRPKLIAINSF